MRSENLHSSIVSFKEFVKKHPGIIKEVRNGRTSWQTLYEDWYLLGEEDEMWEQYKTEKKEKKNDKQSEEYSFELLSGILAKVKNMDVNQMQEQIANMSSTIQTIQNVIYQFQGNKQNEASKQNESNGPFAFRKD